MILDDITPMSPMVEHIMTMAHTATEHDFTCGLTRLRNILKEYKKVGPHARISRLKSYIKIIKNEDGTDAVIIQGPWRNETGSWHYVFFIRAHTYQSD